MSDVERPSNGGGKPGNGSGAHGLPARNMADIARLFLEGARPVPARVSPARRTPPTAQPTPTPAPRPADEPAGETATTVLGLACPTAGTDAWRLLVQAAQGLAPEQTTTVAVVGLLPNGNKTSFVVDVVGVETMEELPVVRTAQEAAGGGETAVASDLQIARALHRLRPAVGLWIISAPPCEARSFPAIASIVREWLLACPTDNDGLIGGYQYLKKAWTQASAGKDLRLSPTVYLLSEDYAQAAVVHKRLRKAAQEFLGVDLALAGAGPIRRAGGVALVQEPIRVLSVACDGPEDALWAAVLDELCPMTAEEAPATEVESALDHVEDHAAQVANSSLKSSAMMLEGLAQVLEPEERAALAASFEEPAIQATIPCQPVHKEPVWDEESTRAAVPPTIQAGVIKPTDETEKPVVMKPVASAAALPRPNPASEPMAPVVAAPRVPMPVMPVAPAPMSPPAMAESPVENPKPKPERPAMPASEYDFRPPLRIFDVDGRLDRAGQWRVVEQAIWDLAPRSAVLDARPPMSWAGETSLVIDAAGRVNVWTLFRDGVSWFALREWAQEHRPLLALTRRDLTVDKAAEVALHIVLPLEEDEAAARRAQEAAQLLVHAAVRNLHVYRLRMVQWGGRGGVAVIPLT
jgi:hypothetical protein